MLVILCPVEAGNKKAVGAVEAVAAVAVLVAKAEEAGEMAEGAAAEGPEVAVMVEGEAPPLPRRTGTRLGVLWKIYH